jgi:hypothetical protein
MLHSVKWEKNEKVINTKCKNFPGNELLVIKEVINYNMSMLKKSLPLQKNKGDLNELLY